MKTIEKSLILPYVINYYNDINEIKENGMTQLEQMNKILSKLKEDKVINDYDLIDNVKYVDRYFLLQTENNTFVWRLWAVNYDYRKKNNDGIGENYHLVPQVSQLYKLEKNQSPDILTSNILILPASDSKNKNQKNNMPYIPINDKTENLLKSYIRSETLDNNDNYILRCKCGSKLTEVENKSDAFKEKVSEMCEQQGILLNKKKGIGKFESFYIRWIVDNEGLVLVSPLSYNLISIAHSVRIKD